MGDSRAEGEEAQGNPRWTRDILHVMEPCGHAKEAW